MIALPRDHEGVEKIPASVEGIIERLRSEGYSALLVGGCVRDRLLDIPPKDWDIATDAKPPELLRIFPGSATVGAHFGVVMVGGVEVATFRSDGEYADGRRPSDVHFETDPREDAKRRDFTINGMFLDPSSGEILDFVGGREDLARGVIRAIGVPELRFREDHLRLLRTVRFAARFDFTIEPNTAASATLLAARVRDVAVERTRDEISRILVEGGAKYGFELLHSLGMLAHLLPEVEAMRGVRQPPEYHPEGDVWVHTLLMLSMLKKPTLTLALGVLLHDVGKPPTFRVAERIRFDGHAELGAQMTSEILGRLRYPNHVIERVRELVAQHMKFGDVRNMRPSTLKKFLRQELFEELLELHRIDCAASHGGMELYGFCSTALREMPEEELRPPPLVTGRDVLALGVSAGPEVGRLLRLIEDAQLEGRIKNREEAFALLHAERGRV